MRRYAALVTLHARIEFDAKDDDEATRYANDYLSNHPQAVANRAKLQNGWICDDYGAITVDRLDEDGYTTETLCEV
jgi:hypothetical protein